MYFDGTPVTPIDMKIAFSKFYQASLSGDVSALGMLAYMYYSGVGVGQNQSKGINLALFAAGKGNALAQTIVGVAHDSL